MVLLLAVALIAADSQHFAMRYRRGRVYRTEAAADKAHHHALGFTPNATANFMKMPVDHQNSTRGSFRNKYYVDTTFWDEASGPCIVYLNGEGPVKRAVGGFTAEIARDLKACTLAIEHRWYGASLAAPLTNTELLTATLTTEQAMQDVVSLITHFEGSFAKRALRWVLVGGSYSGALVLRLNEKYPGKFKASWAASAVVRSGLSYPNIDAHVKSTISHECAQALRHTARVAAQWMEDPARLGELRGMFHLSETQTTADVMWAFADAAASVQYGASEQMCETILPTTVADPREALRKFATMSSDLWGADFMNNCHFDSQCLSNPAKLAKWGIGGYSWVWQRCNELPWWQVGGYDDSIRSERVTVDYFAAQCRSTFGNVTSTIDMWSINTGLVGLRNYADSHIIVTRASADPWSSGSDGLASDGPNFVVLTADCPACGHCGSVLSPTANEPSMVFQQRKLVMGKLKEWVVR